MRIAIIGWRGRAALNAGALVVAAALAGAPEAAAAPTASFGWSPSAPVPGEPVTFTSTSAGDPVDHEWDLDGDNVFGARDDPDEPHGREADTAQRSFASPGRYTVRLRVRDARGAHDTAAHTVVVEQRTAPPPGTDAPAQAPPEPAPEEPSRFFEQLSLRPLADEPPVTLHFSFPPPIVGACAAVYEGATAAFLYVKNGDTPCFTGSTAKAVTIHVALAAVKSGLASLIDQIQFSADSVDEYCTCMGNYADNLGGAQGHEYAVEGEKIDFDDALYGTAMSAVEPTVSLAEWIANAVLHDTKATGGSNKQASLNLRKEFVGLMNQRFAALGLTSSTFSNEHGGDKGLDGLPVPKSTARDMARFWGHAINHHPWFLTSLGLRNQAINTIVPPGILKPYTFRKWYGYYPRVQGDKNGGVTPPGGITYSSLLGSSSRLGRTLSFNVMENADDGNPMTYNDAFADSGAILQYAFAKIFRPRRRGHATTRGTVRDEAIDCWGKKRCVAAARTTADRLRVSTWRIQADAKDVDPLDSDGPSAKAPGVFDLDVARLGSKLISVPPGGTTARAAAPKGKKIGNDITVTIERRKGGGLHLRSWKITPSGAISQLGTAAAGQGVGRPRLHRLSQRTFVSAARLPSSGKLELTSWRVSNGGTFTELDDDRTGAIADDDFALTDSLRPRGVMGVVRTASARERLILWSVGKDDGKITRRASSGNQGALNARSLSIARVGPTEFMTAHRKSGTARVNVWGVGPGRPPTIVKRGDMTEVAASNVTATALQPLGPSAALLGLRAGGKLRMVSMEFDAAYENEPLAFHVEDYFVLGDASGETIRQLDLGRVKTTKAQGDHVAGVRTNSGRLRLINWRTGPN